MSATAQPVERREEKRYKAKQGAFAVLRRPWPDSTILGRMVDLTRSQRPQIEHFIRNYTLDLIPPTITPSVA
jgi:hypothetical protein